VGCYDDPKAESCRVYLRVSNEAQETGESARGNRAPFLRSAKVGKNSYTLLRILMSGRKGREIVPGFAGDVEGSSSKKVRPISFGLWTGSQGGLTRRSCVTTSAAGVERGGFYVLIQAQWLDSTETFKDVMISMCSRRSTKQEEGKNI